MLNVKYICSSGGGLLGRIASSIERTGWVALWKGVSRGTMIKGGEGGLTDQYRPGCAHWCQTWSLLPPDTPSAMEDVLWCWQDEFGSMEFCLVGCHLDTTAACGQTTIRPRRVSFFINTSVLNTYIIVLSLDCTYRTWLPPITINILQQYLQVCIHVLQYICLIL